MEIPDIEINIGVHAAEELIDNAKIRCDRRPTNAAGTQQLAEIIPTYRQKLYRITDREQKNGQMNIDTFSSLYRTANARPVYNLRNVKTPDETEFIESYTRDGTEYYKIDDPLRRFILNRSQEIRDNFNISNETIRDAYKHGDTNIRADIWQESVKHVEKMFSKDCTSLEGAELVNTSDLPKYQNKEILDHPYLTENETKLVGYGGEQMLDIIADIEERSSTIRDRKLKTTSLAKDGAKLFNYIQKIPNKPCKDSFILRDIEVEDKISKNDFIRVMKDFNIVTKIDAKPTKYQIMDEEALDYYSSVFQITELLE